MTFYSQRTEVGPKVCYYQQLYYLAVMLSTACTLVGLDGLKFDFEHAH